MNGSVWWDGLDGDNLACRPGNNNQDGFVSICLFANRVMPSIQLFFGMCFFLLARLQDKLSTKVQSETPRITNSAGGVPSRRSRNRASRATILAFKGTSKARTGKLPRNVNHGAIVAFVSGVTLSTNSLAFFINGYGTIYASDTLPGRIGDFIFAIQHCAGWYVALLQVRGAKWFKGLVQLSAYNENSNGKCNLASASNVLDSLQGRFGPLIAFAMWVLLATGVLPRAWFYMLAHVFSTASSFRAFVAISTQRVSALRVVASIQNQVRGTAEDMQRRRVILRSKTAGLVVDIIGVFIVMVMSPLLVVILGSSFSSRQMVVHHAIVIPFNALPTCAAIANMHAGIKKRRRNKSSPARVRRGAVIGRRSNTSKSSWWNVGGGTTWGG